MRAGKLFIIWLNKFTFSIKECRNMDTYHFRFNDNKKTAAILLWFFTALLTVSLTTLVLVLHSDPLFPIWLLLISFPLMLLAIYKLFKVATERQSLETISLSIDGFTSACFGFVLFSEIHSIQIPALQISLLGGRPYDYYKITDADVPNLLFSITISNGKTLNWILNEWGGFYNSEEDFSVFFNFLTALTDQLYQLHYAGKLHNSYLKILDEKGFWENPGPREAK